jgi:hydrogenase/urease accessory protein HupE
VSTSTIATRYVFEGLYTCSAAIQNITDLQIHSVAFREYLPSFDHYVNVSIQRNEWEIIFSPTVSEYPAEAAAVSTSYLQRFLAVAQKFTWMGMLHIYTGYDHILFLLSVILLMRSLKKILLLVTSFTVAHSITLILASFNIISLSPSIVEPLIAASIAFMALRNIMSLRKTSAENPPVGERWLTTFGFGLIHGLGFATALAATSIPKEFFVPSLVIFNVGIELGQLTILLVAVPLLLWLDKRPSANTIFKYISYATCALALLWFFERLY